MKVNLFVIILFFGNLIFAQDNSENLKISQLLNSKKIIELPTNAGFFTSNLRFEPDIFDCPSCKQGFYYQWAKNENFTLRYAQYNDNSESITINYFGNDEIAGLPFDLIFNHSSEEDCYSKFKKYNPVRYQDSYEINESESAAFSVLEFKIQNTFIKLAFLNDDNLSGIILSTSEIN